MIGSMDLNASPQPEEDDEIFEQRYEEYSAPERHTEHKNHVEHVESAVDIARREREERRQRLKRDHPDDRPMTASQPPRNDMLFQTKHHKPSDRNKLPPGWLDCPAVGQEIGCIIPSKVPLGEAFNDSVLPGKRYSSRQVIHQQRVLGRKLGLVIDLTNTSRYYLVSEWKKEGIKHVKISCKGRDSVPDNDAVNHFVYEVSQFVIRQKQSKKYILVHCTHGHNRTGFMIVHYLMRTLPISVTQAIKKFADARPPGIYKPDYIDALYNFYHERKPDMVIYPSIPEWKRSSELDLNGDAMPDEDDDGAPASPFHENHKVEGVMSNDDILGDSIPSDQQEAMRQFCYQSLKLGAGVRGHSQFPGSHPVSLNRDNLQLLRQRYYYATWKADGTRYMMLITMDGCFLIDRNFTFRRVQMRFPCKPTSEGLAEKTHHFTLLDGEMIIDTLPDSQKQERRYLIYDMMAINQVSITEGRGFFNPEELEKRKYPSIESANGQKVVNKLRLGKYPLFFFYWHGVDDGENPAAEFNRPFYERWKMLEKEVIEPRNYERHNIYQSQNPYYRYDLEPFRVRRKDFWLLSTVTKLLKEFIPRLSHAADGLVFQGWDDPYVPRTHEGLLKWKYPEMNSVDFLFEMVDTRQLLFLHERGKKKLMDGNKIVFNGGDETDPSSYSGKIVECSWDSEGNVWICMRVRTDKATPNDFNTYRKVMRSIKDNITEDILLNEINEIIRLPMYADRIRSDSKAAHHSNSARRR